MGWFLPLTVYAAEHDAVGTLVRKINTFIINPLIALLFALALVLFLWGIVEYFWQADSEIARERGRTHMIWGIAGMFIMFAAFAIIRIIGGTLGVPVPGLP